MASSDAPSSCDGPLKETVSGADGLAMVSSASPQSRPAAVAWVVLGLLPILLAVGCAGGGNGAASATPVIGVTERDFHISAPKVVMAGDVVLRVRNDGPDTHELLVVRAANVGLLPIRTDGLTLNEESLQQSKAGALEPGEPHVVRDLRLQLAPGRYVLFCNMAGHFMAGMRTMLVVR